MTPGDCQMEKIDVFNHIYPPGYFNFFEKRHPMMESMASQLNDLIDFDSRIRRMDSLGINREILSLALPGIDDLMVDSRSMQSVTRTANDSMRDIADSYPDRFLAIGTISLTEPDFAVEETIRCVKDLKLLGIQVVSNVKGKPLDTEGTEPFYSVLEKLDVPLWIHPTFMRNQYQWMEDFRTDIMVGWDFDTTLALIRLAGFGIIGRHRKLKVIVHHLGSLIPVLAGRIAGFISSEGKSSSEVIENLKSLYVDTAEGMWMPWLGSAIQFFGIDHIMFGTDFPWGDSRGILENIEKAVGNESDLERIYEGNAKRVIRFK